MTKKYNRIRGGTKSKKRISNRKGSKKVKKNRTPPGTPPSNLIRRPGDPDTPNIDPYTGDKVLISYHSNDPITVPVLQPPMPNTYMPDSFNTNIRSNNSDTLSMVPSYEDWGMSIKNDNMLAKSELDRIENYLKTVRGGKKIRKTRKRKGGKRNTKRYNPANIPE